MQPFELARRDPSLLRRAVAFFHASGDVLHYDHVESLHQCVFLKPQWLVDLMAALVRHDLEARLSSLDEAVVLPADLQLSQVAQIGAQFLSQGILDERLLGPILWAALEPDVTTEPGLIAELLALMVHMGICSPWTPSSDGGPQWLVPLRLPAERATLPQDWLEVTGDADASTAVGWVLEFGAAASILSGCVGQLLAHCTAMAGLSGRTVNWLTGLHARISTTGHSSFPFVLTIEQSGPHMVLRAHAAAGDAHVVLLQALPMFENNMPSLMQDRWPGCSPGAHVILPGPMTSSVDQRWQSASIV